MNDEFFILFSRHIEILTQKFDKSRARQAVMLLHHIVTEMSVSVDNFVHDANNYLTFDTHVSKTLSVIFKNNGWSSNTIKMKKRPFKELLTEMAISDSFIHRLSFPRTGNCTGNCTRDCTVLDDELYAKLAKIVGVRVYKNASMSERENFHTWYKILVNNRKNCGNCTMKSYMMFFRNFCFNKEFTEEYVRKTSTNKKKFNLIKFYMTHILAVPFPYKESIIKSGEIYDILPGDHHTIPPNELDILYETSREMGVFHELFFLIFITTGMRVNGLVRIRLEHICKLRGTDVIVNDTGRTLEKGNKWFEFAVNDTVKNLIKTWVVHHRVNRSDYLFSGKYEGSHISTNTIRVKFNNMCDKANLQGRYLHVHALRHSYAHILLNCGNDILTISKLLNHTHSKITEKYYLRENVLDVVDRANIPWLDPNNKPEDKIPRFLNIKSDKSKTAARRRDRIEMLENFRSNLVSDY